MSENIEQIRFEIESELERKVAELSEKYPTVWIRITGTLSKSEPSFVDWRVIVDPKTEEKERSP